MVFGSSWEADEKVYVPWLKEHADVGAIIAPHEFDKNRLAEMRRRLGSGSTMLFSDFKTLYQSSLKKLPKPQAN